MAKILPFARAEPAGERKGPRASAEIVFFPGVRVEYHDGPPPPVGTGRPRRGPRRGGPPKGALSA